MEMSGVRFSSRRSWGVVWLAFACCVWAQAQPSETVAFSPASAVFADAVTVQLSGAKSGQYIRYVIAAGPDAASAEVTAAAPIYAGPIVVTRTSLIRAAVFGADGSAGRTTSGHFVKRAPALATFSSRLPVLVLDVLGAGPLEQDGIDHASWLFGFEADGRPTFADAPDFANALEATVRGSSSAGFPKKGYNIRMRDAAGRSRAQPIFDLPAYDRWALVAPWAFDPNFINNSLIYELSNRLGRWAPRTKLVELFLNANGDELEPGDYGGIYVVTDRIRAEPGRVEVDRLGKNDNEEPAVTGGYILKIDPPDEGDIGWVTNRGVPAEAPSQIVLVEPDADDVTPAQLGYIQGYVQQMEDALHADRATGFAQRTYLEFLDRSSWVDHHILNVLANNPDALHRSAYFTKPREGRLQAGPVWDFDRALGGDRDDRTSLVDTWSGVNGAVDVWRTGWWGVLAEDPDFVQEWADRWQSLRGEEFSTGALTGLVQALADVVGDEAATRDYEQWPDTASFRGSYAAQIQHLKTWLTQRAEWIDSQFVAPPARQIAGQSVTFIPPEGALLVYTTDGSDPRESGGAMSPVARVHAGALTVPAAANLRVRSYDPTPRDQFPATPWSGIIESYRIADAGSPGRIINLSSKARVGNGPDDLIIGFVVADTDAKRYLLRGVGPGLAAFGEPAPLRHPEFVVNSSSGVLLQAGAWENGPAAADVAATSAAVGAFPLAAGSADAATVADVRGGSHTIQIRSQADETGYVLGEVYEVDVRGRTANVSIRGRTSPEQPLTGGFVITNGTARVLIRAVGPTLRDFGVDDAVVDPVMAVYAGPAEIASNDTWSAGSNGRSVEEAGALVGAFRLPEGSQDAALVMSLPSGNYTVEVRGVGTSGVVLLELYDLP